MKMTKFYAKHNAYATETSSGFANTWEISRFADRLARDKFVEAMAHKGAQSTTRADAIDTFAGNYRSVGKDVPRGGLFGEQRLGSNFYNENVETLSNDPR
jgi:hypothetical protein